MSNKNIIFGILADRPVAYHPDIARICGGVKPGIFLSQLMYWSGKEKRKDGFIWKTQEDWEVETGLTRREQETARKILKNLGVLIEKLHGVPATLHYKIDFDKLYQLLDAHYRQTRLAESAKLDCTEAPIKDAQTSQSIPENTSESTKENNNNGGHGQIDEDYRTAVKVYEQEIGMITMHISGLIIEALNDFTVESIVEAIREASQNNVRKWSYVDGILKNWKSNGRGKKPAPPKVLMLLDEQGNPTGETVTV